jgi:5-methyltetrahydropteroyltriglutamate--homocysteine methyltransferase
VQAFCPGIYARSEALVQATRDLDRGRTSPEAVDEQFARDLEELVRVQQEAGLDPLTDGMLRWQDLWRAVAEASDGLEARPLVRFLDTNTFYRALLVEGDVRLREPLPPPDLPGRWMGTLPSPFCFARAANDAADALTLARDVLAPQIEAWAEAGCALVVLDDPFLAREPEGVDVLGDALTALPHPVPLHLRLPFGDAGPLLEKLAELPVDGVGIDFYATSVDVVPDDFPKTILAGVVDARSSALEEPEEVARFVEALRERRPAGLALVPNGDLQFVPEAIARRKVGALGRAAATIREEALAHE